MTTPPDRATASSTRARVSAAWFSSPVQMRMTRSPARSSPRHGDTARVLSAMGHGLQHLDQIVTDRAESAAGCFLIKDSAYAAHTSYLALPKGSGNRLGGVGPSGVKFRRGQYDRQQNGGGEDRGVRCVRRHMLRVRYPDHGPPASRERLIRRQPRRWWSWDHSLIRIRESSTIQSWPRGDVPDSVSVKRTPTWRTEFRVWLVSLKTTIPG